MLRKLTLIATLLGASTAFAADGKITEEELEIEKIEVKYDKSVAKDVEKLAKKWHKNADKAKDNGEVEGELKTFYKDELAYLRALGIETVDADPQHPAHLEKVLPADDAEKPKLEELRDIVVELKKGEIKDKKYGEKLDDYVDRLWKRYERKDASYDKHKEQLKG